MIRLKKFQQLNCNQSSLHNASEVKPSSEYDTPKFFSGLFLKIGLTIFLLVEGKQKIDSFLNKICNKSYFATSQKITVILQFQMPIYKGGLFYGQCNNLKEAQK